MTTENANMSAEDKAIADKALFEGLLQTSFEDIEDLPEYATFPNGVFKFLVSKAGVDHEKAAIKLQFSKQLTVELATNQHNADLADPKDGSLFGVTYGKEFGIKKFKQRWKGIVSQLGASTPEELLNRLEGQEVLMVIGGRFDRDDPTKYYNEIIDVTLAGTNG